MSKKIENIRSIQEVPESGTFWVAVDGGDVEVENVKDKLKNMKYDSDEPFSEDASFLVASHGLEISLLEDD